MTSTVTVSTFSTNVCPVLVGEAAPAATLRPFRDEKYLEEYRYFILAQRAYFAADVVTSIRIDRVVLTRV
jgi:hypothetical protein